MAIAGKPKILGKVKLEVEFHFKDNRRRDVDNYLKVLIDALKDNLFEDDYLIWEINAKKFPGTEDKTVIKVTPIA
jgi:Holliday junction resolvase RusA-like endonuclease